MKKVFISLLLVVLVLFGCAPKQNVVEEVKEKIEKSETFILYVSSSTCSACATFQPILDGVVTNYDLEYVYWENNDVSVEDRELIILDLIQIPEKDFATPLLILIKEGQLVDYSVGSISYSRLKDMFIKNGFIE